VIARKAPYANRWTFQVRDGSNGVVFSKVYTVYPRYDMILNDARETVALSTSSLRGMSSKEKTLYKVPNKVKQNATRGLSLRYGLGGTDYFGSMQIAHELIKGQVDFDTLSGMWDFWNNQADHYKNEAIELMWGGMAGMAWVNGLMRKAEKPNRQPRTVASLLGDYSRTIRAYA